MNQDQLEKLRQILSDFYKVVYWADPFNADEFMKKTIEELGGQVKFINGTDKNGGPNLTSKFLGKTWKNTPPGFAMTGYHQDDDAICIMHDSHSCCILDEELALKILVLGMPGEHKEP